MRDDTLDLQIGKAIRELSVFYVDQETVVTQEISAQNWVFDVGNYEQPSEVATEPKVEGERAFPVRFYRCIVDCLKKTVFLTMRVLAFGT